MKVACYNLRVSQKRNFVLLVKLKDALGVVDGDRMLGENGIYYQVWELDLCGAFRKIGHWDCDQLNVCCERDYGVTLGWKPTKCMKRASEICSDVFRLKHK